MPIPPQIDATHIRDAIEFLREGHEFDEHFGPSTTYDVLHEGVKYPPKQVIALAAELATGVPLSPKDFSGGEGSGATNPILRRHGFTVVDKDGNVLTGSAEDQPQPSAAGGSALHDALESILAGYNDPSLPKKATSAHPMQGPFQAAQASISSSASLASRPEVRVSFSIGAGNLARVPWIALLHRGVTTTTTRGVYVVYLFAHDMSAVYLTLNQGVTDLGKEHGSWGKAQPFAEQRAEDLRVHCAPARAVGFLTAADIHLDPRSSSLGKQYESTTVCWKRYDRGQVPDDQELLVDLEAVLTAYDDYVASRGGAGEGRTIVDKPPSVPATDPRPLGDRFEALHSWLDASGYTFEPFQVAAYLTARA